MVAINRGERYIVIQPSKDGEAGKAICFTDSYTVAKSMRDNSSHEMTFIWDTQLVVDGQTGGVV